MHVEGNRDSTTSQHEAPLLASFLQGTLDVAKQTCQTSPDVALPRQFSHADGFMLLCQCSSTPRLLMVIRADVILIRIAILGQPVSSTTRVQFMTEHATTHVARVREAGV